MTTVGPVLPLGLDAAGFARLYHDHHRALLRYCRRILRDDQDAQDAVQSTMERAFTALKRERRGAELRPWLFVIAHNEAVTILRRRRATAVLDESFHGGCDLESLVVQREALRSLETDIASLSERQRTALLMRAVGGAAVADVAARLGCSVGAAKSAIWEARQALLDARAGRELACLDVRAELSDGRRVRGRALRAHLLACPDCRTVQAELAATRRRPSSLALPFAGAALFRRLVAGATGGWSDTLIRIGDVLTAKGALALAVIAVTAGGVDVVSKTTTPRPAASAAPEQAASAATGNRGVKQASRRTDASKPRVVPAGHRPVWPTVGGPASSGPKSEAAPRTGTPAPNPGATDGGAAGPRAGEPESRAVGSTTGAQEPAGRDAASPPPNAPGTQAPPHGGKPTRREPPESSPGGDGKAGSRERGRGDHPAPSAPRPHDPAGVTPARGGAARDPAPPPRESPTGARADDPTPASDAARSGRQAPTDRPQPGPAERPDTPAASSGPGRSPAAPAGRADQPQHRPGNGTDAQAG